MSFTPNADRRLHAVSDRYQQMVRLTSYLTPFVLLIIRLAWGWELFESGRSHLANVSDMAMQFHKWGIPFPELNVYISGWTEMLGGVLLMIGLGSRIVSIPLIFNFCIAYLTASRENLIKFFQQDPSKIIDDAAFPFLIMSLLILAVGPGLFSIDAWLKRAFCDHSNTAIERSTSSALRSSDAAPMLR